MRFDVFLDGNTSGVPITRDLVLLDDFIAFIAANITRPLVVMIPETRSIFIHIIVTPKGTET